jgi:hypothetical protein
MQQRRVDQAENRRRRSDAQRLRQNRNGREARRLRKHAQRVAQILNQVFKERQTLLRVVILSHCAHPSELHHGLAPSLFHIHPRAQILLRLQGQMLLHLFPKPFVVSPPGGKILEPRQKPSRESHALIQAQKENNISHATAQLLLRAMSMQGSQISDKKFNPITTAQPTLGCRTPLHTAPSLFSGFGVRSGCHALTTSIQLTFSFCQPL